MCLTCASELYRLALSGAVDSITRYDLGLIMTQRHWTIAHAPVSRQGTTAKI
jgi:hypothetical protein